MKQMDSRDAILNEIQRVVIDFLVYNRKEDEDLPRGEIEKAIKAGEISVDEIVNEFAKELKKGLRIKK